MDIPKNLLNLFNIASNSESTVLITGETGTGKTFLAKQIHDRSKRKGKPFVTVNLASLHEGTLESELFGHERGAFTGAEQKRVGRLELAQGGTVFLDEVGELSPRLQARLLEFLQNRKIAPVGSARDLRLDVRVIAATHRNLAEAVTRGQFREDLFHRLRVVAIPLKSLRERQGEFDSILHFCLKELCEQSGKSILKLSPAVAEHLEAYHWPGNVRELRNVLEYAVLASEDGEIQIKNLPAWLLLDQQSLIVPTSNDFPTLGTFEVPLTLDYRGTFERFEKEYLQRALSRNGGRVNRTARQIGINKTTLIRRIRAYRLGIDHQFLSSF
jgi:DNA-binding NtrC family response regulator